MSYQFPLDPTEQSIPRTIKEAEQLAKLRRDFKAFREDAEEIIDRHIDDFLDMDAKLNHSYDLAVIAVSSVACVAILVMSGVQLFV